MIQILVPMAGRGSRFTAAGYELPKPLLPVHGLTMIELVIRNLTPSLPHRFIFLCLREHLRAYGLAERLRQAAPSCEVIAIDGVTEGAAITALAARAWIDNQNPLLIANSDQWVDYDVNDFIRALHHSSCRGLIMTMEDLDPKWSYVRLDDEARVTEVVEKRVVSNHATVGIYGFRHGNDFVRAADAMIARNERVNGEFYVAPVYNELIGEGARVDHVGVGRVGSGMHGLGTPDDYTQFLRNPISRRAAGLDPAVSLIIPLFNEGKNIPPLIKMLDDAALAEAGVTEVVLVDNGSTDGSAALLENAHRRNHRYRPLRLSANRGYGGGVFAGLTAARADHLAYVPGDLQVTIADFLKVWEEYLAWLQTGQAPRALFKGRRTERRDSPPLRFLSRCYSRLAARILGVKVHDVNGLPKIFHRSLLDAVAEERMTSFTLDAQLLLTAARLGWPIQEVPVAFLARREGISSWSGKRLPVAVRAFRDILRLRKLPNRGGPFP